MKVLIQGKQMTVPDELKSYVMERLVKVIMRFYDSSAAELRVEFGDMNGTKGGNDKECHLTFRMPMAQTIQIEEVTQDPYASLDAAGDRLVRIIKRELERMRRKPSGHHKYHPLGASVAEGGIPGGTLEELRFSDEAQRLLETGTGITAAGHERLKGT
ncbi:MAG: HPF/RaiA family ribosome-associated protein [Myxococcales bacterium]|jgi:putative sigma-54 modulation protein